MSIAIYSNIVEAYNEYGKNFYDREIYDSALVQFNKASFLLSKIDDLDFFLAEDIGAQFLVEEETLLDSLKICTSYEENNLHIMKIQIFLYQTCCLKGLGRKEDAEKQFDSLRKYATLNNDKWILKELEESCF